MQWVQSGYAVQAAAATQASNCLHTHTPQDTMVLACLIGQFGLILWQKTSEGTYSVLLRATKKIKKKTFLDQKIPQKNYMRCKSCLSVLEHLKKYFFSFFILFFFFYLKMYVKCKKFQHLQFSFHSTSFVCFRTVFTFYVAPQKKRYEWSEVFPPSNGWCEFTPAWGNHKQKIYA